MNKQLKFQDGDRKTCITGHKAGGRGTTWSWNEVSYPYQNRSKIINNELGNKKKECLSDLTHRLYPLNREIVSWCAGQPVELIKLVLQCARICVDLGTKEIRYSLVNGLGHKTLYALVKVSSWPIFFARDVAKNLGYRGRNSKNSTDICSCK